MSTARRDGDVNCVNIFLLPCLAIQNPIWKSHQIGISSFCTSNQSRRLLHSYLISSSNLASRRAQTGRNRTISGDLAPTSATNNAHTDTNMQLFLSSAHIEYWLLVKQKSIEEKTLLLLLILPRLSLRFPLSWHGDMHDKSGEANCELCLSLYRKHKGISGIVNQRQLCCRQTLEQWPQTPLASGKRSQPAISLARSKEIKRGGKWENVIQQLHRLACMWTHTGVFISYFSV